MAELNKVLSAIRNAEAVGDTPAVLRLTQLARDISAQDRAQQAPRESDYPEANKRLSGYLGTIPRGIAAGVAGLGESALTGASFLLPEEQEQAARAAIARGGAAVQEAIGPEELYRDTLVSKLSQGLGSTLPFLAAAPFGLAGIAAAGATGVAAGAGEAATRAVAAGATEEEISRAAALGMGPGALEMAAPLAIVKRFGVLKKALGSETATDVVSRLRRVGQSAGEEGLQEAVTEIGQNLIAQGVYDPNTGTFAGTGESFGLGAGVGGLLQGLFELALPKTPRKSRELSVVERQELGLDTGIEGELVPPEPAQIETDFVPPQERPTLPPPRQEAILVAPDGTAFPERYKDDYRAAQRARSAELAEVAPELRQAREAQLARDFLAAKEAEEAAAVVEVAKLRAENPGGVQLDMFPELQAGARTTVTQADLTKLGIPKTSRFAKELPKLDLSNAEEARTAAAEVVRYANLPTTKKNPARREAVFGLLNLPAFRNLEATTPTTPTESVATAPQQLSLEEQALNNAALEEQARIVAEREAAFAVQEAEVTAQQKAAPVQAQEAFAQARDAQREENLAADAAARATIPAAGAVTSPLAAALNRAQTRGEEVPGQAQLEIRDQAAAPLGQQDRFVPDTTAQPAPEGPTVDEQIAEAQRVLAQLETQKAEQGGLFGPEGGVLRGEDKFAFTREGGAQEAEIAAQEREITTKAKRASVARRGAATKRAKAEEQAATKETTEETTDTVKKLTGEDGKPLVLYRGIASEESIPETALRGEPREGYAVFASTSPYVAASYSGTLESGETQIEGTLGEEGIVTGATVPLHVYADRVIEFPVRVGRDGSRSFSFSDFDDAATKLPANTVLVARQVYDSGPRVSKSIDPESLYSFPSDIYAWSKGTKTTSATEAKTTAEPEATKAPTSKETKKRAEAAKQRAEAAKKRAEAAKKRAEAAKKAEQDKAKETAKTKADVAARSAAPVVEGTAETVVEEEVEVDVDEEVIAAERGADEDLDAQTAALQDKSDQASRKAKNKNSKPKKASKRAANIDEDVKKLKALDKSNPFFEYFNKDKDINGALSRLAADVADRGAKTDAAIAAELWVSQNLSTESNEFFGELVRLNRRNMGMPLPTASMAQTSAPLSSEVIAKLEAGDLRGAIDELAKIKDNNVQRVAAAISKGLGNTKVVMASNVVSESGEPVAGLYDPKTDTITLNQDVDLSNHVLLHEAMHAVTSHEIAKNTPAAKQMRALFESIRSGLDSAYGATNLDEFVAEAFSNPNFQSKLAGITVNGERITLWDKFKNIIQNILRRFRGQPSKKLESAMDKVDMLVTDLISPAPEYRNATALPLAAAKGEERKVVDSLGKFVNDRVSSENIAAVSGFMRDAERTARKTLLDMLPLPAIANVIEREMPAISKLGRDLVNTIQDKAGARQKYLRKTNDTAAALTKAFKGRDEQKKIWDAVIGASTMDRVDPSKPRSDYKNDTGKLEKYDRLQKEYWSKLDQTSRDAYVTLRDSYAEMYAELKKTLEARIDALEKDPNLNKQLKDRILGELLSKEAIEPYFPLYRKGDYWLQYSAVNPDTGNIEPYKEAFESERQRQVAKDAILNDPEILDALRDPKVNKAGVAPETLFDFSEYDRIDEAKRRSQGNVEVGFAAKLLAELRKPRKDDKTGEPLKLDKQTEKMVLDMLLDAMPERGLARALQQREGVLGFKKDAIKVLRERMPNIVNQTVNLQYETELAKLNIAFEAEKKEAMNKPGLTLKDKQNITQTVGHFQEYIEFAKNPQLATWSRALKSAGFGMTLGFNVSSVLVNWTNLPIVVLPYLGGKYGYKDANRALFDAHKRFMATPKSRTTTGFGDVVFGTAAEGPSLTNVDYNDPATSPELQRYKILAELLDRRGQANTTMTSDALDMENPASTVWTKVNATMGYMFHQGERLNRQVSAMATFDLEMQSIADAKYKGDATKLTDADLEAAAQGALDAAELTNSGALTETAPRFAQSNLGSVLFMYKRFGVSMLYLQARMAKQAFDKNLTGDERTVAKKQLAGLFATSGLLAGVQGLPLYGVISFIMNTVFLDDEDEDFDTMASTFFSEGAYSGAINYITGADVAPRIGMTNLVFRSLPNKEQDSLVLQGLELFAGPVYGVANRAFGGIGLINEGEVYRGVEKMVPSFASNVMKSARYSTEGVTTLRGDPIVEDINPLAIAAQAVGLAPASYTQQLERNSVDKRIDRNVNTRRTKLLREYYIAKRTNDFGAMGDINERMQEFNEDNPDFPITPDTIERSLKQHERTSDVTKQFGGVTISPRRRETVLRARMEAAGEEY